MPPPNPTTSSKEPNTPHANDNTSSRTAHRPQKAAPMPQTSKSNAKPQAKTHHNPQDPYQCHCRPTTSKILVNENVLNRFNAPNEKKFARILYNPTDYSKIRATNSSLPYSPLTISTKFSNTYCTSSNDILVFSGSVISFSNK